MVTEDKDLRTETTGGWISLFWTTNIFGVSATTYIIICLVILACLHLKEVISSKRGNLPPGPWRVPLLGSTAMFSSKFPEKLAALSRKYGDVMSLYVGGELWVVLSSADVVREAYIKNAASLSGRLKNTVVDHISEGYGIAFNDKPYVRAHKKLLITTLKNFGMGRSKLEVNIHSCLDVLLQRIRESMLEAFDPALELRNTVGNVIGNLIFGPHFRRDDESTHIYTNHLLRMVENFPRASVADTFPFLKILPGDPFRHNVYREARAYWSQYIYKQIDAHRADGLQVADDPRDLIDAFLQIELELKGTPGEKDFTDVHVMSIVVDAYTAGIDTTATVLLWAILYLVMYPDVQERIHRELEEAFPRDVKSTHSERNRCPFTEAFICEVLRICPVAIIAFPHRATADVTLRGYNIPKDTRVVHNIVSAQLDDRLWSRPREFRVDRFLTPKGELDPHTESLIPFSVGRRACPGETLARMEIFILLAGIVKEFKLVESDQHPLPTGELGVYSLLYCPRPYSVIFQPRRTN